MPMILSAVFMISKSCQQNTMLMNVITTQSATLNMVLMATVWRISS